MNTGQTYLVAVIFALLLCLSVFLHELAHGLAARHFGVPVREYVINLWGGHTSFGSDVSTALSSAVISIVGPAVNGVIAIVAWFAYTALPFTGVGPLVVYSVALSNGFVAVFNAIPGLPLDGGRVLESLVWWVTKDRNKGTVVAGWCGRGVAVAVVLWFVGVPFIGGNRPDFIAVAWAVIIAGYLWVGAGQAISVGRTTQVISGLTTDELAQPAYVVNPWSPLGTITIDEDKKSMPIGVIVGSQGEVAGFVDHEAAMSVPTEVRAYTLVEAVAVPLPADSTVADVLTGKELLNELVRVSQISPLAVVVHGEGPNRSVTGAIFPQDVAKRIQSRRR